MVYEVRVKFLSIQHVLIECLDASWVGSELFSQMEAIRISWAKRFSFRKRKNIQVFFNYEVYVVD
ncbi:hypothetical protein D0894_15195 [Pseudomonas monteilii]|uniref:Uncharacterized protein n=1 Tax=Pseudomonas monteilii TaxID=76759 RepID=A0A399M4S7_9PSED|nr:hypothetical protein D0894_15195 [Pseudomonas monteilii]